MFISWNEKGECMYGINVNTKWYLLHVNAYMNNSIYYMLPSQKKGDKIANQAFPDTWENLGSGNSAQYSNVKDGAFSKSTSSPTNFWDRQSMAAFNKLWSPASLSTSMSGNSSGSYGNHSNSMSNNRVWCIHIVYILCQTSKEGVHIF